MVIYNHYSADRAFKEVYDDPGGRVALTAYTAMGSPTGDDLELIIRGFLETYRDLAIQRNERPHEVLRCQWLLAGIEQGAAALVKRLQEKQATT